MKPVIFLLLASLCFLQLTAQPQTREKKYPSLLWEISGRGLKKPSYLIGTMHVSNKMAFHLPDSFYIAVRSAQVVALETNPETWQEDMSKYELGSTDYSGAGGFYSAYTSMPSDYLQVHTLQFYKYYNKIERALYSNPSTINNLLYRSDGNEESDFEEDTYLDMYIFQCGKKWGKKITGVENYGESMRLMSEAYRDAAKDKNRKDRSYGEVEDTYSTDKLEDAYRLGNLDLLDSINKYNSFSAAFDEKFLYRRNEIQAHSIDSILLSGAALFAGVGAAHLPGDRGLIELLRRKGYKLRPVKMGERASKEKDQVDRIRVPVVFHTETARDGLFQADIPGRFYKFGDDASLEQQQYADMANGSYYMVTRIMTNAWMWNHNTEDVYRTVDSLLYENIPGKIIAKTTLYRNGYKGFDIQSRTRRGDLQRYHIFISPFEIIFFKMSGNGDYIKYGTEAERFFGSIHFKEYRNNGESASEGGIRYAPPTGGFAVNLPQEPYIGNDGSWIYDAENKSSGSHYRIIRSDIHNYHFLGEDSFDLALMNESFKASDFIDTELSLQYGNYRGYPSADGKYRDRSGQVYLTRFLIQGPHYYTLIAHARQETAALHDFLNSFEIRPFVYGEPQKQEDTALYFSVATPFSPGEKKIKLTIPRYSWLGSDTEDEDEPEADKLEDGVYRSRTFRNDTTGERIFVYFFRASRYYTAADSAVLEKEDRSSFFADTNFVYRLRKKAILPDNTRVWDAIVSDSGSSRTLRTRVFYRNGIGYALGTESDTLSAPSAFVKSFFDTFTPADTLRGTDPFEKKSKLFFRDLLGGDTILQQRAFRHIDEIKPDSTDLPQLVQAIHSLSWKQKKYLDIKTSLIDQLGQIRTRPAADYLKQLYYSLDDTVQLQYPVLENLLQHRTTYAFSLFRDIMKNEPPVLDDKDMEYSYPRPSYLKGLYGSAYRYQDRKFLDELFDSLQLSKTILPDLLPLLNLEDYKSNIMRLLACLVDSNLAGPGDYEMYFSKFLVEAKQELKKQAIAEKKKSIEKAEEIKAEKKKYSFGDEDEKDYGNADLSLYSRLLLPFARTRPVVQDLIGQMLRSGDKRLKYNTLLLLLEKNYPFPDSLLSYFAGMDDYRYELYRDLKEKNKLDLFPSAYKNHLALGRSALLKRKTYARPDSVLYLDRLPAVFKGRKGFIYFYKYKTKKDDNGWKLASVGLVPEDPRQFEFQDSSRQTGILSFPSLFSGRAPGTYDFTAFSETKLKEEEPLEDQLKKALKRLLFARHKSGRDFYKNEKDSLGLDDYSD